jgi:translation initiation factor IF-2
MTIRLNKVTRDLNVGISTVVDFLQKKGFTVENNPNAKISPEQYDLLVNEFSNDKKERIKSEEFIQSRQKKDRNKVPISGNGANAEKDERVEEEKPSQETEPTIKVTIPEDSRPKFKPVGKIDLDQLNKKKPQLAQPENVEKRPVEAANTALKSDPEVKSAPLKVETSKVDLPKEVVVEKKLEEKKPEAKEPKAKKVKDVVTKTKPVVIDKEINQPQSESKKVEESDKPTAAEKAEGLVKQDDGIFTIRSTEPVQKINVIGKIDLSQLNQSTRPKKKTKDERRKEREDKDRQRMDQRKQIKDSILREIRGKEEKKPTDAKTSETDDAKKKKKRSRISKERVDIKKVAGQNAQSSNSNGTNNRINNNSGGTNNRSNNRSTTGGGNNSTGNSSTANRGAGNRYKGNNNNHYKKGGVVKPEVNGEDVAKQIKETLARLTTKGKNNTSKYRKEKRESALSRERQQENREAKESKTLKLTEFVTANELASMMDIPVTQVIATCMSIGMMVSINQRLDAETINMVAEEFGFKTEYVSAEVAQAIVEEEDKPEDLVSRPPIVTVMGHVDHGKTSLLDYIRSANVIAGEAGGITQHIGAYNVTLDSGRHITFLDTPGHEAFTAMRARGAQVTDIAIIIVAADDDVMPQTKEAINHAAAAGVPIVFAINKVDKPTANPDKIKETLANMNYLVEEWGGKYQSQDISAKKGTGVKDLLEKVLLEADMLDLKANPKRKAMGSVIESSLDKGRGYVATVLVSNGSLKVGDIVLAGTSFGRIKAMFNERNQRIEQAAPSEPALILGLSGAPQAGDSFHVIDTEQEAREITNKREQLQREQGLRTQKLLTLDEVGRRIALGNFQELNIIVKGDVDGSIEALSDSLIKLSTPQIQVNVIHKAVGQISESDVSLAAASDAVIIGFQVRPSAVARRFAEQEGVDIRIYSVIYAAIEEVKSAMEGMLAPVMKEQVNSTIEVREVYHISKVGTVAGAIVKEGKVKRSDKARLIRDGIVIFTGQINALKRFKDDMKEVPVNFECGISLVNYSDIQVGDLIESFEEVEVKQTL